jgi:hypothetical protein
MYDGGNGTAANRNTYGRENHSCNKGPHNSYDDIAEKSESVALYNEACQPSGDRTDNNKNDQTLNSHGCWPFTISGEASVAEPSISLLRRKKFDHPREIYTENSSLRSLARTHLLQSSMATPTIIRQTLLPEFLNALQCLVARCDDICIEIFRFRRLEDLPVHYVFGVVSG